MCSRPVPFMVTLDSGQDLSSAWTTLGDQRVSETGMGGFLAMTGTLMQGRCLIEPRSLAPPQGVRPACSCRTTGCKGHPQDTQVQPGHALQSLQPPQALGVHPGW